MSNLPHGPDATPDPIEEFAALRLAAMRRDTLLGAAEIVRRC